MILCKSTSNLYYEDIRKDGSMNFTVDNRQLNGCTKKNSHAMPDPQTVLDKMYVDS